MTVPQSVKALGGCESWLEVWVVNVGSMGPNDEPASSSAFRYIRIEELGLKGVKGRGIGFFYGLGALT